MIRTEEFFRKSAPYGWSEKSISITETTLGALYSLFERCASTLKAITTDIGMRELYLAQLKENLTSEAKDLLKKLSWISEADGTMIMRAFEWDINNYKPVLA